MAWKMTYYISDTERALMELLAKGLTHNQIGLVLHLSGRTVSTMVSALQRHMRARNTAHFVALMFNNGFLIAEPEKEPPPPDVVPTEYSNPQYNEL